MTEFKRYLFEYRHENSDWGLEIAATSPQDARERLKALVWARYQGEIKATFHIPAGPLIQRIGDLLRRLGVFVRIVRKGAGG